jgi:polysaccharide biosynthesis transport protein
VSGLYDELRIILHTIWLRRWLALGIGWAVATLGWVIVSLIPNTYESQARILVRQQSLLPDQPQSSNERLQSVDQIRQTLTSTVALEKVVRGTDLALAVSSERQVTERATALAKKIIVRAEQDNLFVITAESGDRARSNAQNAKLARQITQKLVDLFVDGSLAGSQTATGQSLQFIDNQLADRGKQLAEAESKRSLFEQKYMALLPGVGTVADRIAATRSEIVRIEGELMSARSSLSAMNAQLAGTPASTRTAGVVVAGGASSNAAAMATVQAQIADGVARGWTESHPDMISLKAQLARLQSTDIDSGPDRVSGGSVQANPMYVSLRSMQAEKAALVNSLEGRRSSLQGQINRVIATQATNPQVAAEQTELDRAYLVLKAQYDKLLQDREAVKLSGDVQTADKGKFTVIDPPSAPQIPASPNRPILLSLVLVASVLAGCVTAFLMGQLQSSYPTANRLAKSSGLPVLGTVHEVPLKHRDAQHAQRTRWFAGGVAALGGAWLVLMAIEFIQRAMVV